MSEEKKLKARVVHKHKTAAEWYLDVYDDNGNLRDNPFVPLDGELIIFDPEEQGGQKRFKFGDGSTNVMDLPFVGGATYEAAQGGGLIKNANNEFSIDDTIVFFFNGGTAADVVGPAEERLEGDGQEFYTMAPSTLSFRSTAPLNELQTIQINGQTVDPSNYELEEGSTIVKLKYDYLSTLDTGKYELSVVSDSKTVKGDFTVATPELNEYGFYYNVPYYVSVFYEGAFESVVLFYPDTTAKIYQIDSSNRYTVNYTYENGIMSFNLLNDQYDADCPFSGTFSNEGKELSGIADFTDSWLIGSGPRDVTLSIAVEKAAVDDVYVYARPTYAEGIEYFPHNVTLTNYPAAKNNILGKPVQSVAYEAFQSLNNVESIVVSDSVTTISSQTFSLCDNLTNIILPSGITTILSYAFSHCVNLTHLTFTGTIAQWNAINKSDDWCEECPITHIHCIDGDVAL